jgi:probable F420-dependent oxidoreductase
VHLGIVTPVLTALPGAHAAWERDASWDEVVAVVRAADRLGYSYVTCSEHVAVPVDAAAVRGGRYWDPLATFGYLAAVTEQIHLATYVLVLGYHHPLEIAKRYGTLDAVAGGRLILGVGVGTLREEFDLLGAPFEDRGERADEALEALRGALGVSQPRHHGRFYDYDDVVVDPHAPRPDVPIWIGGRTPRSLRRALAHGDGWAPFGLSTGQLSRLLGQAEVPAAFDVVLQSPAPIDPQGAPDEARAALDDLRAAGATHASLRFVHHSPAHYVEQLEAARELSA